MSSRIGSVIVLLTVVSCAESKGARVDTEQTGELWKGTYNGNVVWDCGPPTGRQQGKLAADIFIKVADGIAVLSGPHTITGSCSGPKVGNLTSPISVTGKRTGSEFTFPSTLWGPSGPLVLTVTGDRATGRLTGAAPGAVTITLDFDVRRCPGTC